MRARDLFSFGIAGWLFGCVSPFSAPIFDDAKAPGRRPLQRHATRQFGTASDFVRGTCSGGAS